MCYPKPFYRFICILFTLYTTLCSANEALYRLSNNDGLSNSAVNAIFQDSEGIMWFGTWDGLNRYDGTSFTQFRPVPGNEKSISHQIIRNIFEEDKHHLWIATDYGINRLNKLNGEFTSYFLGYKDQYTFRENSFLCSSNSAGLIAASAYGGELYIFDPQQEKFFSLGINEAYQMGNITSLFFDERESLWIQNDKNELYKLILKPEVFPSKIDSIEKYTLPQEVKKVYYDKNKNIWFEVKNKLFYIDIYAPKTQIQESNIQIEGTLNYIFSFDQELYIGTTTSCISIIQGKVTEYIKDKTSTLSIYKGSQNIIWIGTDGKGIYKIQEKPNFLTLINHARLPELGNFAVRAIYKDEKGNIWVGSKGGGLTKISYLGATTLEQIKNFNVGTGFTNNSVLSIEKSFDGDIWIGTDGYGLFYYSAREDKIKKAEYTYPAHPQQIYSIYSILQTTPNTLYLGSSGGGLLELTLDDNKNILHTEQFNYKEGAKGTISSNIIYAIIDDGDYLWIGTRGGGLNRFHKQTKQFTVYKNYCQLVNSISSNDVISLYKDHANRIWVGTTAGLNLVENIFGNQISFKRIEEGHGLPNTNIHAIQEDSKNQIWASTSKGLARIDPATLKITSYYYEDGLQDNEFSDGASFATADRQELYFGGINGFNIIHPNLIGTKKFMPNLLLSKILIDNIETPLLSDYSTEKIIVGYQTGSIALDFSILDFVDNKKCQIAYQLVNNSLFSDGKPGKEWINPGPNKNIILNKSNPGDYTLYVKYSNADQLWNSRLFKLDVEITPPLWATWWAITLYILFLSSGTVLFYYIKRYKMQLSHELELEKQEKIKKEEIHQAKLRFFTNIAHEFSNSITLIYGSIEQIFLNGEADDRIRKQLISIKRNAERMHGQIQQLMEFRKAETGHLAIQLEKVDVGEMIRYTLDSFSDMADSKKIEIRFSLADNMPVWITDRNMLEKIIFNLLSNALKYTPAGGHITIGLEINAERKLVFTCTNSGAGIKPEDLRQIFNRFTILDHFESKLSQGMYTRNGIGLAMCQDFAALLGGTIYADSKVNEYTTFTVELPRKQENELCLTTSGPISEATPVLLPLEENTGQKSSILIVDDQEDIRELITDILTEEYNTFTASNGKEALAQIAAHLPDLIICDVIMPEMDGISLVRELKQKEETRYIPIIMLSSKSNIENQISGLESGANLFISKPFHPRHLKVAVERVLGNNILLKEFSDSPQAYKEKYNNQLIPKADKLFIDRVIELLQQNFADENYNQDSLADDLLISRVQLYRKIKQITQKTPGEFIRNFRIKQAEKLLIRTNKTVLEIMNDCGFRNKAYFYREFAKIHNCSPKDFRTQSTDNK